jgi:hypothetical protein
MNCKCGQTMALLLRTVVYSQKVTVYHVPVFTCPDCNRSEIHSVVKPQLTSLIRDLGNEPRKQKISFHDVNEFSNLLFRASSGEFHDNSVDDIIHIRVNELLDLLILAESINDSNWVDEIHSRLDQISDYSKVMNQMNL